MFSPKVNTLTFNDPGYPLILKDIPSRPQKLFFAGSEPNKWLDRPKVAIVGSRKITSYGQVVTRQLTQELVRAGVVIISGLAYGADSLAHTTALQISGLTVAVLPTPLDRIYPASHTNLARQIIESQGTLLSEYPLGSTTHKVNFIARNRIVSGLADILLITEASASSGTMSTARFALEQGKTVMAVPGNINSPTSEGCNNLIKSGAVPVTTVSDILFALKISPAVKKVKMLRGTKDEETIFMLILAGVSSQEELAIKSNLDSATVNTNLTSLEISGYIRPAGNGRWVTD